MRAVLALALMMPFAAGCPTRGGASSGPVEECTEMGEQCRLRQGVLGVCAVREGECAEPPCLYCRSQH